MNIPIFAQLDKVFNYLKQQSGLSLKFSPYWVRVAQGCEASDENLVYPTIQEGINKACQISQNNFPCLVLVDIEAGIYIEDVVINNPYSALFLNFSNGGIWLPSASENPMLTIENAGLVLVNNLYLIDQLLTLLNKNVGEKDSYIKINSAFFLLFFNCYLAITTNPIPAPLIKLNNLTDVGMAYFLNTQFDVGKIGDTPHKGIESNVSNNCFEMACCNCTFRKNSNIDTIAIEFNSNKRFHLQETTLGGCKLVFNSANSQSEIRNCQLEYSDIEGEAKLIPRYIRTFKNLRYEPVLILEQTFTENAIINLDFSAVGGIPKSALSSLLYLELEGEGEIAINGLERMNSTDLSEDFEINITQSSIPLEVHTSSSLTVRVFSKGWNF